MRQPRQSRTNKAEENSQENKPEQTIDPSSPEADQKIMEILFHMATVEKNPTVLMFWAKTKWAMSEKVSKKELKATQAPTVIIRSEEKPA
jgi:hypothetical protein